MHRVLIGVSGFEAAEVRHRGRAFRDGTIYREVVKGCKLFIDYGQRLDKSKRRFRVRKDGRLASKSSSTPVSIQA